MIGAALSPIGLDVADDVVLLAGWVAVTVVRSSSRARRLSSGKGVELSSARLRLRPFQPGDRVAFASMNADPQVMEHFPAPLSPEESNALATRIEQIFESYGYGLWALELPGQARFVGFAGLLPVNFESHFTPAVEVGWRLRSEYWGRGYATEAARAALEFAFTELGLIEVVSFTVPANWRSRAVMDRLDMTHDPADDFDHPKLSEEHPLRRHVLYRLPRERWEKTKPGTAK